MNVLIPAVASKEYFDFLITRFFVADQEQFESNVWDKVKHVSDYNSFQEFKDNERKDRYKLDELINFFTLLAYQKDAIDVIGRCDFSYSWWRPMFWMIAIAQENRFQSNGNVRKFGTKPYLKEVVKRLDLAYQLRPIQDPADLILLIKDHPKLKRDYKLDPLHCELVSWGIN